jgi:SEC-C motif
VTGWSNGDKELAERLGRNDPCPCGSGVASSGVACPVAVWTARCGIIAAASHINPGARRWTCARSGPPTQGYQSDPDGERIEGREPLPTSGSEAWASQAVLDSAVARCVSVAGARFPGPV